MKGFHEISPEALGENVFDLIGKQWMLITAGDDKDVNTMTASWGGMGVLWGKNVCFIFVRPQRYTFGFLEKTEGFTLSFFEESHRKALELCGSKSGRDLDKIAAAGLTKAWCGEQRPAFEEAKLVVACRKLYYQDLIPEQFLDPAIDKNYPRKDYHRMYVGAIEACYTKE